MATRESPYPQLGANGQPVPQKYDAYQPQQGYGQQQQQHYAPPAGAPPQPPQQAYQMPPSNNYAQPQAPPPQQQYGNGYGNGYGAGGEKVQPLEVAKPK